MKHNTAYQPRGKGQTSGGTPSRPFATTRPEADEAAERAARIDTGREPSGARTPDAPGGGRDAR